MSGPIETRAQHLQWCKERALAELANTIDVRDACKFAFASMSCDLRKHPDTENHAAIQLGAMLLAEDQEEAHDREAMRRFILKFN